MTKNSADTMLKLQFLIGDYSGLIKIVKNRQKCTKLNDSYFIIYQSYQNLPAFNNRYPKATKNNQ